MGAPEGLPQRDVPLGLLRLLQEPLGRLVYDGCLRQPHQGAHLPAAPAPEQRGGMSAPRPIQAHPPWRGGLACVHV